MISDESIERALEWMTANANAAALAAGEVIRAEEMVKTTLALVASGSTQETIAGQDREARASQAFKKAVEERVAAVYADRKFRLLYAAATSKIEVWRSQQANNRGMDKIG